MWISVWFLFEFMYRLQKLKSPFCFEYYFFKGCISVKRDKDFYDLDTVSSNLFFLIAPLVLQLAWYEMTIVLDLIFFKYHSFFFIFFLFLNRTFLLISPKSVLLSQSDDESDKFAVIMGKGAFWVLLQWHLISKSIAKVLQF